MNNSAKYLKNILALVVLYSLAFLALAEIDIEVLRKAEERRPPDHLYVKNPKDIDKMTTVTYYLSKSSRNTNANLIDRFYAYAKDIGESNGAVAINMKDRAIIGSDDKKFFDDIIFNKLCEVPREEELPALIFHHKNENKCFVFKRVSDGDFLTTLNALFDDRDDVNKLGKVELKVKLGNYLKDAIKNSPKLRDNEHAFRDFIEYLVEKT